jgi:NAD-dependent SIR2 family protein deacetylase
MKWPEDGEARPDVPRCPLCSQLIKPDLVFFEDYVPGVFYRARKRVAKRADLLLVMGTSMKVAPVSTVPRYVTTECHKVLLNREPVWPEWFDNEDPSKNSPGNLHGMCLGECDDLVTALSHLCGWGAELDELIAAGNDAS